MYMYVIDEKKTTSILHILLFLASTKTSTTVYSFK